VEVFAASAKFKTNVSIIFLADF